MTSPGLILGICGGIAAYKTPELIRQLVKAKFRVVPVLTKEALHFVTKTTINTVSGERAQTDIFSDGPGVPHLEIAKSAPLLLIAPATANIIAKMAHGLADDLLTNVYLSFTGRVVIVPAMHTEMFTHPATRDNLEVLRRRGVLVLGPDTGELACLDEGVGRMVDPVLIVRMVHSMFLGVLPLAGKRILITAGGTREKLDEVRLLTNRSTGELGHRLADVAAFMGAEVTLITTLDDPIRNPHIKKRIRVDSVNDLKDALDAEIDSQDVLYMAAAVSDYRVEFSEKKLRRQPELSLKLIGTSDLLSGLSPRKGNKVFIGFCLESENLEIRAKEKLIKKNLDYIVANGPQNIGSPVRELTVYSALAHDGQTFSGNVLGSAHWLLKIIEAVPK